MHPPVWRVHRATRTDVLSTHPWVLTLRDTLRGGTHPSRYVGHFRRRAITTQTLACGIVLHFKFNVVGLADGHIDATLVTVSNQFARYAMVVQAEVMPATGLATFLVV